MGRVVVGVDGSPAAAAALRWGLAEAALRRTSVLAVHAYRSPVASIDVPTSYAAPRAAAERLLADEVAKALAGTGLDLDVEPYVTEADPARTLVALAGADDVLVVGSRDHGVVAGALLGSVSHYVVAHAACPAVVVHARTP